MGVRYAALFAALVFANLPAVASAMGASATLFHGDEEFPVVHANRRDCRIRCGLVHKARNRT